MPNEGSASTREIEARLWEGESGLEPAGVARDIGGVGPAGVSTLDPDLSSSFSSLPAPSPTQSISVAISTWFSIASAMLEPAHTVLKEVIVKFSGNLQARYGYY